MHISDDYRNKLDEKSHACIMMGYSDESKSHKLFDPSKQHIILSQSVFFDEMISDNQLLNSSPGPLNNDPFDNLEESGSTVSISGVSTRLTRSPESTGGRSTMNIEVDSSTSLTDENQPESLITLLPRWTIKTIEAAGLDVINPIIG